MINLEEKRRILDYAKKNNMNSRFYIISIDIGNKQTVDDLLGNLIVESKSKIIEDNWHHKFPIDNIPKFYYAVKDFATGEIVSKVEENLSDAIDYLKQIRIKFNENHCIVRFYDEFQALKKFEEELKDA